MQGHVLTMAPAIWDRVWRHLLPDHTETEQAAFLFCRYRAKSFGTHFEVADVRLLEAADFASQRSDYIELTDAARIGLIKHAHATSTCLQPMARKWCRVTCFSLTPCALHSVGSPPPTT